METRGREWSDLSALQGMPNVARSPLEPGERRGMQSCFKSGTDGSGGWQPYPEPVVA